MTRERPILFSGPMVRALLEGRKDVTRRVIRDDWFGCLDPESPDDMEQILRLSPYQPGDRLWVRETWREKVDPPDGGADYRADDPHGYGPDKRQWRPSIFMRRQHCRLERDVVSVRAERLQEITEDDAVREGVAAVRTGLRWSVLTKDGGQYTCFAEPDPKDARVHAFVELAPETLSTAREKFAQLWDAINGKRPGCSWASNPWVWRVEVRRATP